MTRKCFWDNPYQDRLLTRVRRVEGSRVFLEDTIFYPFSGAQESDAGTIAGLPVLRAAADGDDIAYHLPEDHGLRAGSAALVVIDWQRRYRLMRLHLAAELVLELAGRALAGVEKIGAHISAEKARLDFLWPDPLQPLLPGLSRQIAALVARNQPVISAFADPLAQRRYWEIEGFARVPCGGTHLRCTGEIGKVALKRVNIGRGKERIDIFVDEVAPPPPDPL